MTPAGTRATSRASSTSSSTTSSGSPVATSSTASPSGSGSSSASRAAGQRARADGRRARPGRRRHPARGDGRHLGRCRRGAADATCVRPRGRPVVHASPTSARRRTPTSRGSGSSSRRRSGAGQGRHGMKVGLTLPQGCDREYLGLDAGDRLAANRRGRPLGRGARLRVAVGLRPHAGRSAARGGADLRAVRRALGPRDGHESGAPRAPRPRRRLSQRRA